MSATTINKIFIIGGTGAQGLPVIRGLVKDGKYAVRVLTRDVDNYRARSLKKMNPDKVELVEGSFANEDVLRRGFRGCDGAFVNIDDFNTGEKAEIFWAIRSYEIAIEEGVKFFVYGNLDFVYKNSGYDPKFRTGHYDGKGRIGEWILQQNKDNGKRMGAALFTTGPYIEMAISSRTIFTPTVEDGIVTWRVPIADGAVVHVALDDCEFYVRWLFDNYEKSNGLDLQVSIAHLTYTEIAAAFEKVTGHPARFIDVSLDEYWASGNMAAHAQRPSGYNSDLSDPAAVTMKTNFTGFWNMWRHSGGNDERSVIRRDYGFLDSIYPDRIKTAEEWWRREDRKGQELGLGGLWERVQAENLKPILKVGEDLWSGKL